MKELAMRLASEVTGVATSQQAAWAAGGGVVVALFTSAYGMMTPTFELLLWLILGDYMSGMIASVVENGLKGLRSRKGFIGLGKKGFILFIVLLAHKVDVVMGTAVVMPGAIYFYIANELISITENAARMKVPVPDQITSFITAMKGKGGGGGNA